MNTLNRKSVFDTLPTAADSVDGFSMDQAVLTTSSPSFTGLTVSGLTASRALATGVGGVLTASATTSTELGYVNGVTSAIQTQLGTKWNNDGTSTATAAWDIGDYGFTALNLTADPTLGAELSIFDSGWGAGTGWAWSTNKFVHSTGSVALTEAHFGANFVTGTVYKIVLTYTCAGTGGITVAAAGQTFTQITTGTTSTYYIVASAATALTVTPTSGWTGSIDSASVKAVTYGDITVGNNTLDPTGLTLMNGSAAYPALRFLNASTSGFYVDPNTSANTVYLSIAGASNTIFNQYYLTTVSTVRLGGTGGVYLTSPSAALLQLGEDSASAIDQIIRSADGSGADKVGAMLTLQGGQSTGTGIPGGLRVQTPYTGTASNSTAQTEYTRYHSIGKVITLADGSATDVVSFAVTAGNSVGGMLIYTITVYDNDASDNQVESGFVTFCGLQDEANWHTDIDEVSSQALESGTLATTWAIDTATANTLKITCLADSSLTTPVITLRYQLILNSPIVETI